MLVFTYKDNDCFSKMVQILYSTTTFVKSAFLSARKCLINSVH